MTYEELYENGKFVKDGAVLAAMFRNDGRVYRAARYIEPSGHANYYTPEGEACAARSCARRSTSRA